MNISLITGCLNCEATIAETIQSVLSQVYPDVEYIIIDGASTDTTLSIVNQYAKQITYIVSEPDGGMYEAINKGLRLASGDVIGLLHAGDTFYSPRVLSDTAAAFARSRADIVYGNGIYVRADNPDKIVRNWVSGSYNKPSLHNGWLPLHPTVYARREVFARCGLYDESYRIAADSDMLVRMLYKHDFNIHYVNEYMVRMRMGGMSTAPNTQLLKWKEDVRMYREHGFNPYRALGGKVLSKIPQFIRKVHDTTTKSGYWKITKEK